jgi:hypothetical protein
MSSEKNTGHLSLPLFLALSIFIIKINEDIKEVIRRYQRGNQKIPKG